MGISELRSKYLSGNAARVDDRDKEPEYEYSNNAAQVLRNKYVTNSIASDPIDTRKIAAYDQKQAIIANNGATQAAARTYLNDPVNNVRGGGGTFDADILSAADRESTARSYALLKLLNNGNPMVSAYAQVPAGVKAIDTIQENRYQDYLAKNKQAYENYMTLSGSDDFGQYNTYRSSRKNNIDQNGQEDGTYRYTSTINERVNKNPDVTVGFDNPAEMKYQYLTDDEIGIFNYLYNKEGYDSAKAFLDSFDTELNARARKEAEAHYAEQAKNEGWAATMGRNVLQSPLKVAGTIGNAINYVATGGTDQNAWYNSPSYISQARDKAVMEDMSPVGQFAYQTGESMGNFILNGLIGAGIGGALGLSKSAAEQITLNLMSSQAAADTLVSLKDQGYSDNDAIKLSLLSGFAEYITERVSLESLLNMDSLHSGKMAYIAKNFFAEGSEEVASDMINLLGDILVMGDQSQWEQKIRAYEEQGMSREEAFGLAVVDQAKESGLSFLGGALSGGIMAGGAVGISNINAINQGRNFKANNDTDALYQLAQQGQYNDEKSAAYRSSARLQQTLDRGRTPSALQVGNVLQYQAQANAEEALSNRILQDAVTHLNEDESITEEDAKAIRENQVAMQELRSVVPDMKSTFSGINDAVKTYIATDADIVSSERNQIVRDMTGKGITSDLAKTAVQKRFGTDIDTFVESASRITDTIESEHPELANTMRLAYNDIVNNSVERQMMSGEDFAASMIKAYNLGQEGKSAISLTKDMPQIAAAYVSQAQKLGVKEGEINGRGYGNDDVQEWTNSNSSTVAGSGLEAEGRREIGSTGAGREAYLSADPGEIEPLAEVSNKQIFGDIGGAGNVRVVKPSNEFIKAARAVAKASGFNGTMHFTDGVMTANEGKGDFAVDGWISSDNKHIYVNLHPAGDKTAMQVIVHELTHFEVRNDKTAVRAFRDNISKDKELADLIERGYKMLYDTDDIARAWEESYCDAKAKINAFTGSFKLQETAKAVSEKKSKIQTALTEAQKPRAPTQPSMTKEQAAAALNGQDVVGLETFETYSLSTLMATDMDAIAKDLQKLGYTTKEIKQWVKDIYSVGNLIHQDPVRLDYISATDEVHNSDGSIPKKRKVSSFVSNSEYGGSIDSSTICAKRRLYTGTIEEIQFQLPNTVLTEDDYLRIKALMEAHGLEVQCAFCYVEGSRLKLGEYTGEFLKQYKATNPMWMPTQADLATASGLENVRVNHNEAYEAYLYFMNNNGRLDRNNQKALFASQQKPKMYMMSTAYNGEIRQQFLNIENVKEKNENGGIRFNSFSDQEIFHLIDTMQVIMDMASVGLAGQGYTKQPIFAKAFGGTGMKINLSTVAKGVDANGKIIFENTEGMNIDEALKIRNGDYATNDKMRQVFRDNVGIEICVFNDEQLFAALADDRIDFIIPFHRSQYSRAHYDKTGLTQKITGGIKDYTNQQNEKWLHPKEHTHEYQGRTVLTKCTNFMPNTYWDFSKSGKENAEKYLEMCYKAGKRPKFYKLLKANADGSYSLRSDGSTDGYWKLLSDYKMYASEDGTITAKGTEQLPVKPDFNMDAINSSLKSYQGTHRYEDGTMKFESDKAVVKEFVSEYKAKHKDVKRFSRATDDRYLELAKDPQKNEAELQRMVDETAQKNGYVLSAFHGTGEYFNTFLMGYEGIHLGNKEQANQVAKSRYEIRSKDTTYKWSEIKKNIDKLDYYSINKLLNAFENAQYVYDIDPFNGKEDNNSDLIAYGDKIAEAAGGDPKYRIGTFDRKTGENVMNLYAKIQNPFVINGDILYWSPANIADVLFARDQKRDRIMINGEKNISGSDISLSNDQKEILAKISVGSIKKDEAWNKLANVLSESGYDGVQYLNQYEGDKNSYSYIALHPSDVKLADPVTYDDNGNVIPLSERFNKDNNDIRFSRGDSNFDGLYETLSDGRIKPKNVADLSTEDWKLIYRAVNKLGYGLESVQQTKDVYSRYVGENGFNKEQSDAIKKAYGVTSDNGVSVNPQREALARKTFGTTGDFREAGYLMRNGSMLDFSGKKEGGPAHVRYMDHREIGSVFSDGEIPADKTRYGDQTAYMNAFISEGNIRLMESQGVTIGEMEPTSQQYTILKQFIDHVLKDEDYFYLDLSNNDGYTVASREYTSSDGSAKIIRDIKEYFKNGELPYRSSLAQFRYSRVADPEEIKRLNSEPTVTVYRAMQVIDGELYPPMAAKLKDDAGKNRLVEPTELGAWYRADERPDLIKDGKFALNKGNGSTPLNVAYNPYWHTSRSMLNDQFSSAYKRPNLVTVECEVPESELTSGYKAEFAKDAVGEMQWHSGPVSSKLAKEGNPRRVILSRWVKVNRVVPDSEAAASIAEMLKGTDITIPGNTVTPSLKEELIKHGVSVEEEQTRFSKGTEKDNVPEIDADGVNELAEYIKNSGEKPNKAITEYLAALYEGRTFVLSDGDTAIMDHSDSKKLSIDTKKDRIATLNKLDEIITKAVLYATDDTPDHRKFVSFKYYAADVKFEGQVYPIQLNVGKARNDGENHIYAITNRKKMPSGTSAVTGPVGNTGGDQIPSIFSEDNLSHNANSVNTRMSRAALPENADEEAAKVVDSLYRRASYNNMSMKYGNYNAAAYTDERIEQEISYSYAEGSRNKDYARAYIAFVKPEDFIRATSSSIWRDQLYAEVKGKAKEEGRTSMLNLDALTNERQSMFLRIETDEDGRTEIIGHEGRHRMIGLEAEGYKYIPVIIEPREYGYPAGQDRYHTKPISSLYLEGQQFYEGHGTGFFAHDILPLSANYADIAREVFASGDNVTRFSRGSDIDQMQLFTDDLKAQYAALQAEVQKQTERAEHFKGETRLKLEKEGADKYQVSDTGLTKIEQKLKKDYSSNASIRDDLRTLINDFLNGRTDYDGAFNMAMYIGNHIVSEAKELVEYDSRYNALKDYLRKTKISISPAARADIPDFETFRRRNLSKIRITSEGTPIDVIYMEMQSMFGKDLFPDGIDVQSDQLLHIVDVLNAIAPVMENPYTSTSYAEMAVEAVAMDIMQTLLNADEIDKVAPTFADRQKRRREKEVAEAKARTKSYYEGRLNALRDSKEKRIQELKDSAQRARERRKDSEMRTKLLNIARMLQNRKLPAVQRQRLDEIIGDLDTVAKGITGKSIQNLTALAEWYDDQAKNNPDFLRDPVTEARIDRLKKRHIADMTQEEVLQLTQVLQNIENELAYQKKLIDDQERRDTYQLAEATINDIRGTKGTKLGLVQKADGYFVMDTLSGERAIRRMTGYVDADPLYQLTKKLSDGQRDMLDFQRRAYHSVETFTEDKAFVDSITGKKAKRITIEGTENGQRVKVDITPAERISLYLHQLNDSNLYHIEYGGITVPNFDLLTKGKIDEAYNESQTHTIKLRPSEVRAITAQMTPKERAFAQAISRYFNGMSQTEINEVSEKLKGYSLAQVENYFPIESDRNFLRVDYETLQMDGTIEGMGFLKERIQRASTPIMMREAQQVMNQSVRMTSKYVGLAIPVRNINKVMQVDLVNYNDAGERDSHQGTIRQAIGEKWGRPGQNYIQNLMTDLQNPRHDEDTLGSFMNKITSNYAGAVLDMNGGVAIKQAASYPTAMAVLGYKPLIQAMGDWGSVDLRIIEKYTPLQWYRSLGYSTTELGDMASGISKDAPTWLKWIQGMDLITTRKLWKASEIYVQQNPATANLIPKTDDYYKEVARVYNRVIEETQPNYTVMQRPQHLRSKNAITRALNMFKTQPYQNFGILYDAVENFKAKQTQYQTMRSSEAEFALKQARKDLANAIVSQLLSALIFAGMQGLWDALRHKTDKYKDKTGAATVGSVAKGFGLNVLANGFGLIPLGSVALEGIEAATDKVAKALGGEAIFNQSFYGAEVPVVETLNGLVEGLGNIMTTIAKTVKGVADGDDVDGWETLRSLYKASSDGFQALGIPLQNTVNMLNAIAQNAARVFNTIGGNSYVGNYVSLRIQGANNTRMYQNLYQAYKNDKAQYQELYNQMIEDGYSATAIKNFFKKME